MKKGEMLPDGIWQGDCLELLPKLTEGIADLAIVDCPYNVGFDYGDEYDDSLPPARYLEICREWMRQLRRILSPTGSFYLIIGDEWQADLQILARQIGFHLRSHVVWMYSFGVNSTKKFTRSHAHVLYFIKDKKNFTFNVDALKVPSARQLVYKDKRAKAGGRLPDDTWILRPQELGPEGFPATGDTWHISRVCGTYKERVAGAANQLPEHLIGRIIRGSSNPGDVVIDPMCGTGTVPAVAKKLERHYLGFEQSPVYFAMADERIANVKPGDALQGNVPQGG